MCTSGHNTQNLRLSSSAKSSFYIDIYHIHTFIHTYMHTYAYRCSKCLCLAMTRRIFVFFAVSCVDFSASRTFTYIYIYTTYTHTYTHIYTHIYTHTNICAYRCSKCLRLAMTCRIFVSLAVTCADCSAKLGFWNL